MENKGKQIKMLVTMLLLFLLLIIGATYAFFSVGTQSTFGTSTINAQARSLGSVYLSGSNTVLGMDLTISDMSQDNAGTYYASSSGKVKDPENPIVVTLGTATVSPNNDTNYYHCTSSLSVTHTGTIDTYNLFNHQTNNVYDYTHRSEGQIILNINGVNYDFAGAWPSTIPIDFYIDSNNPVSLTASLLFVNSSTIDQTYLAGSDISITISLVQNSLTCTVEQAPSLPSQYYTYLGGDNVPAYASLKVSDYHNLYAWKRVNGGITYPYATEPLCDAEIVADETCNQTLQNYFIKETRLNETGFYQVQYYTDGEKDGYPVGAYSLSDCELEEYGDPENDTDYAICIKEYDYEYYACASINGEEICMNADGWANVGNFKSLFESKSFTCRYYDNDLGNYIEGNTPPEDGGLACTASTTATYQSYPVECVLWGDSADCGVYNEGMCSVGESGEGYCNSN